MGEVVGHPDEDRALPQLAGESHLPRMLMIVFGQGSHRSRRSCALVTGGFNHQSVTGAAKEAAARQQHRKAAVDRSRIATAAIVRDRDNQRRVARRRASRSCFDRCFWWLLGPRSAGRASYQRPDTHTRLNSSVCRAGSIQNSLLMDILATHVVPHSF